MSAALGGSINAHEDPAMFEAMIPAHKALAEIDLKAPAPLAINGRWSGPFPSNGVVPIPQSILYPSGDSLFFGREEERALIINPVTGKIWLGAQLNFTPFCGANLHLADGRVAIFGGHEPSTTTTRVGTKTAVVFSLDGLTSAQFAEMKNDRYYAAAPCSRPRKSSSWVDGYQKS
jgi:hypothetical protein